MNLNELWMALSGNRGPFAKILKALDDLSKDHKEILHELGEIEIGATQWQIGVKADLKAIKDQLDRIEEDVGGGQAVSLAITVGTPEEQ